MEVWAVLKYANESCSPYETGLCFSVHFALIYSELLANFIFVKFFFSFFTFGKLLDSFFNSRNGMPSNGIGGFVNEFNNVAMICISISVLCYVNVTITAEYFNI